MTQMMAKLTQDNSSVSSEPPQSEPVNLQRTLHNVLTKLRVDTKSVTWEMLKAMYSWKPEAFHIFGSVHTTLEGNKTYFSVRIYITDSYYITMHVYGTLRFNVMKATSLSIMDRACPEQVFNIEQPPMVSMAQQWRGVI